MKILLDKEEALDIIHTSLCDGLTELRYSGVILAIKKADYEQAKKELIEGGSTSICREDVYAQILRAGKPLQFYDEEGEEHQEFTLEKATENLAKEEANESILCIKNEEYDSFTSWEVLQFCLYGEIIFG